MHMVFLKFKKRMSLLREVPLPPQQPAEQPVKKTKRAPEYNQWWLSWYKVIKDENGILKTLDCKVPNCKKLFLCINKQVVWIDDQWILEKKY
jgi:hypothetical protein